MKMIFGKKIMPAAFAIALLVAGCASSQKTPGPVPQTPDTIDPNDPIERTYDFEFDLFEEELDQKQVEIGDPLQGLNRVIFAFNDVLYFWVVKPVAQGYMAVAPKPVRIGISNFFDNITTPVRLTNSLLQWKGDKVDRELKRFGINTTLGVLGFGDPAKDKYDIAPAKEDLGQTLAIYGLGHGPYIVLPLLGPSSLRDAAGRFGDSFLNPVRYIEDDEVSIGLTITDVINDTTFRIGDYESLKQAAVDPYVAMRQAYVQYRSKQISE